MDAQAGSSTGNSSPYHASKLIAPFQPAYLAVKLPGFSLQEVKPTLGKLCHPTIALQFVDPCLSCGDIAEQFPPPRFSGPDRVDPLNGILNAAHADGYIVACAH
jgi:hypothetical protein